MRSVATNVPAPTATPSTGACDWIRAAVLTTSPVTIPSPASGRASSATSASPVFTPTRTDSDMPGSAVFSSPMTSRIANAARTARSASSSCATGAPKTAITASPMNFSTVPPYASIRSRTRRWYGSTRAWTSSGSADSDAAVKPTRSQKRTDTTFRSRAPEAAAVAPSGAAQNGQNGNSPGTSLPHDGHVTMRRASGSRGRIQTHRPGAIRAPDARRGYVVITSLPRACPSPRCASAAGASCSGYVRSITDRIVPSSSREAR